MPTFDTHSNFGYSTILTPPTPAISGTTITLVASGGLYFPTPVQPYNVTIWPSSQLSLSAVSEICRVTSVSGDTLTVIRAQEGSQPQIILAGFQVAMSITKKVITDIENAIPATTDQLPQGATNLYFTDQAARNSLSGGSVVFSTYNIGAVSGTVVVDFTKAQYQTCSLSGNVTFNSVNRLPGRNVSLKVYALSTFNMAFNQGWLWLTINYSNSQNLLSANNAILTLTPFGSAETDIVAVLALQG